MIMMDIMIIVDICRGAGNGGGGAAAAAGN